MTRRGNTTQRSFRAPDDLWAPALTVATTHGENLSDILRAALQAYIEQHEGETA